MRKTKTIIDEIANLRIPQPNDKTTNIRIPRSIWLEIKSLAAQSNKSMNSIILESILMLVKKKMKKSVDTK